MAVPWLHCNICLKLPSNCKFYISNCGHVGCQSCFEKSWLAPECKKCKKQTIAQEINKDLSEDLRKYFVNIADYIKKSFTEIKTIIDFQYKNSKRLMKHKMEKINELQNTTEKQSENAAIIEKLRREIDELKTRNIALESENQNLNASFQTQQNVVNQFLTGNVTTMNVTPSFMNTSRENAAHPHNVTQPDLFTLMNASYLTRPADRNYLSDASQSAARSRTVCSHWPKARCRCQK